MIEVIYDCEENAESEGEVKGIRLPKNIRQVGTPKGGRRIYVEDYVVTYLNQLAKPGNTYARGAILLGEYKETEEQGVIFISGALEAQNVEFDIDEIDFNNDVWTEIYNDVKRFFPDLEVVGWFLSRMGFTAEINDKITRTHIENFPGRDKALFMIDALEEEEAWYLFENHSLKKQSGYYIYYTRNDAMQNYMMTQKGHMVEAETDAAQRDQELLQKYRNRLEQRLEPQRERPAKPVSFLYVASSLLTVAFLAMGITVINSYDRLKNLETAFQRMDVMSENTTEAPVTKVVSIGANVEPLNSEDTADTPQDTDNRSTSADTTQKADKKSTSTDTTQEADEKSTSADTAQEADSQSTSADATQDSAGGTSATTAAQPVVTDGTPKYYTVQEGDTLSSISFRMYHSILYVDNIMEANDMKNGDEIYVGQKILIPSIP